MREIKFRVWCLRRERMFYNIADISYIFWDEPYSDINDIQVNDCDDNGELCNFWLGSEVELMQYTGLKDKNGKEIFEGDIVQYDNYRATIVWDSGEEGVMPGFDLKIESLDPSSERYQQYRHDKNYKLQGHFPSGVEVIGNIYENPELLDE